MTHSIDILFSGTGMGSSSSPWIFFFIAFQIWTTFATCQNRRPFRSIGDWLLIPMRRRSLWPAGHHIRWKVVQVQRNQLGQGWSCSLILYYFFLVYAPLTLTLKCFFLLSFFQALLYLIYLLDPLVKNDYIIIYFHTNTTAANHPSFSWLREVYNVLPYKYKKNLKGCYIVHPTIWTKVNCFLFFAVVGAIKSDCEWLVCCWIWDLSAEVESDALELLIAQTNNFWSGDVTEFSAQKVRPP